MTKQYGIFWWDTFASSDMRDKHKNRMGEYKSKVPAFNNVDDRLMSIDMDDLSDIIKLKRYKWIPAYDEDTVHSLLKKQMTVEIDLWKEQFSRYLSEGFCDRFKRFAKYRNHIMHNKLRC